MSENKKRFCPYCKEEMIYGLYEEVLSNKYARVNYFQYGWVCKIQKDDCDMIFDTKKKNSHIY